MFLVFWHALNWQKKANLLLHRHLNQRWKLLENAIWPPVWSICSEVDKTRQGLLKQHYRKPLVRKNIDTPLLAIETSVITALSLWGITSRCLSLSYLWWITKYDCGEVKYWVRVRVIKNIDSCTKALCPNLLYCSYEGNVLSDLWHDLHRSSDTGYSLCFAPTALTV